MGRPGRVQFPGACYLVTLQGNNNQDIFLTNQDRRYYLGLLRGGKDRYGLKVYAFCLMSSSVSLLMETAQGNLSQVMQGFNTLYTKYFNGAHNTTGHVYQGRYKAWHVDKENYLAELTGYEAPRVLLHAHKLAFIHPRSGKKLSFTSPVPADFEDALKFLRAEE